MYPPIMGILESIAWISIAKSVLTILMFFPLAQIKELTCMNRLRMAEPIAFALAPNFFTSYEDKNIK